METTSTIGLSKDGDLTVITGFGSSPRSGRVMCFTLRFFLEEPDPSQEALLTSNRFLSGISDGGDGGLYIVIQWCAKSNG